MRPCVEEMPNLHQAFHKYKAKGFTILSVNVDGSADNARKFRESADHLIGVNYSCRRVASQETVT